MRTLTGLVVTGPSGRGGPAKLRCVDSWVEKLGLSAVSNDGAGNRMLEALGQAFAQAGKAPTDVRTVRTAVVAKMMVFEENSSLFSVGLMVRVSHARGDGTALA